MKTKPFHGEFSSADASNLSEEASRLTLYELGGSGTTTISLADDDEVVITSCSMSTTAIGGSIILQLFDGPDSSLSVGELIARGVVTTSVMAYQTLPVPHICRAGTYPKVKASGSGQVDVIIHGYIKIAASNV